MSFLGFGGSSSSSATSAAAAAVIPPEQQRIVDEIKGEISQEIATTYASGLVNALSENCFELCIKTPTGTLTAEQDKCVNDCSVKFMKSWNVISKNYVSRINQN